MKNRNSVLKSTLMVAWLFHYLHVAMEKQQMKKMQLENMLTVPRCMRINTISLKDQIW